jgi:hypothetical protein
MSGLKEWSAPVLVEMAYTPELRALYYNTTGPQELEHGCGLRRISSYVN